MNVAVAMKRAVMVQLVRDRRRHRKHILSSLVMWYSQLSCSTSLTALTARTPRSRSARASHIVRCHGREAPSLTTTLPFDRSANPGKYSC
jgi:hypothetical protein